MAQNAPLTLETMVQAVGELKTVLHDQSEEFSLYSQLVSTREEAESKRNQQIQAHNKQVQILSQTLSRLKDSSQRARQAWRTESEHVKIIEELQTERFSLAKEISDKDKDLTKLEAEAVRLREEMEDVEAYDVEENSEMDKGAIAASFFRRMGFVPCYLKPGSQEDVAETFQTLMVRSDSKNRSIEFNVDQEEMQRQGISRFMLAEQMWKASE